jgi:hypothetical protein
LLLLLWAMPTLQLIFFVFILSVFNDSLFAEEIDLKDLTAQCISASKDYKPVKDNFAYKVIHTVEYDGWSGNSENIKLTYPVAMIITFTGNIKDGSYWFKNDPQKKYLISIKSDACGNCELIEKTGHGYINYIFHGVMKNGVIKGLWEKGNGKKAFAFYVKARK